MMLNDKTALNHILVATDFSAHSQAALAQAVYLADRTKATVTVVHVVTHVARAVPGTSFEVHWRIPPGELKRAERKLRKQAEQQLADAIAPHRSPGRKLRTETLVGVPFVEIIKMVQKKGIDLVLAGTLGRSGLQRLLVGSTAERLVRKCPCPVWIVKPGQHVPPRTILNPVDFSEVSGRSLDLAAFLAQRFECALNVLHVISSADVAQEAAAPATMRLHQRDIKQGAEQRLSEFVSEHVPIGTTVDELVTLSEPWRSIDVIARRLDADLIVMGSMGRVGIPGILIGNTAEKVLRLCNRSILAVKPAGFISPIQAEP
jgi:nucleotide-binding universal stress UspA family protein